MSIASPGGGRREAARLEAGRHDHRSSRTHARRHTVAGVCAAPWPTPAHRVSVTLLVYPLRVPRSQPPLRATCPTARRGRCRRRLCPSPPATRPPSRRPWTPSRRRAGTASLRTWSARCATVPAERTAASWLDEGVCEAPQTSGRRRSHPRCSPLFYPLPALLLPPLQAGEFPRATLHTDSGPGFGATVPLSVPPLPPLSSPLPHPTTSGTAATAAAPALSQHGLSAPPAAGPSSLHAPGLHHGVHGHHEQQQQHASAHAPATVAAAAGGVVAKAPAAAVAAAAATCPVTAVNPSAPVAAAAPSAATAALVSQNGQTKEVVAWCECACLPPVGWRSSC
jgi:hypothetical protein